MASSHINELVEEEFDLETKHLDGLLKELSISDTMFSTNGNTYIDVLAKLAQVLQIRDVKTSSYSRAMGDLAERHENLTAKKKNLQQAIESINRKNQLDKEELSRILKAEELIRENIHQREQKMNSDLIRHRISELHQSKIKIKRNIASLDKELESRNFFQTRDSCEHSKIVDVEKECIELEKKNKELREKIEVFNNLPLNRDLAIMKIEEARESLNKLQHQFNMEIQKMT